MVLVSLKAEAIKVGWLSGQGRKVSKAELVLSQEEGTGDQGHWCPDTSHAPAAIGWCLSEGKLTPTPRFPLTSNGETQPHPTSGTSRSCPMAPPTDSTGK